MLCIGVEAATISDVIAFAESHEDVWASVGEHPGSASEDQSWITDHIAHQRVVAVGEMGLDYHYEKDPGAQARQRASFAAQLGLAERADLPVIVHTRAAEAHTLALLRAHPKVIGVLHCFTESWRMAEQALAMGYYISISGIVTFKQAENVREVARRVPSDRLLIETDAPWLAPVPHRGQQNQPAYVADTARFLAELRGEPLEHLAATTTQNFLDLFRRIPRD